MSSVFIIMNESQVRGSDAVVTGVLPEAHDTLNGALSALHEIAEEAGIDVEPEADSIFLPTAGTPYEVDEYYIQELEVLND